MTDTDVIHPRHQTSPVQVEIKNWSDAEAKPRVVKKTTLKTYVMDPAGTANGKQFQFCDFEPQRVRTILQVIDNPVAFTTEPPVNSPDTNAAILAPQGIILPPSLNREYVFYGPDAFWLNSIAAAAAPPAFPPALTGVVDTATVEVAAAAAGSLFGPAAGESVAAFGVYFQGPAAATNFAITLSNVLGGPLKWDITVPTTGLIFQPNIPNPIPASTLAVFPTVSVPAVVGGPAYSIYLQSLKAQAQPAPTGITRVTVVREYC